MFCWFRATRLRYYHRKHHHYHNHHHHHHRQLLQEPTATRTHTKIASVSYRQSRRRPPIRSHLVHHLNSHCFSLLEPWIHNSLSSQGVERTTRLTASPTWRDTRHTGSGRRESRQLLSNPSPRGDLSVLCRKCVEGRGIRNIFVRFSF